MYKPVSPHIMSWDEIEELKDFSGVLMVTFNEAHLKAQREKRNFIKFVLILGYIHPMRIYISHKK